MKKVVLMWFMAAMAMNAGGVEYRLSSPDGHITATIAASDRLTWSVERDGVVAFAPSQLGLTLSDGSVVGERVKVKRAWRGSVDRMMASPFYRADSIRENYNGLTLGLGKNWSVEFRAFNDGVAYRFVTREKKPFEILSETVEFQFPDDAMTAVPYVATGNDGDFRSQFHSL